MIFNFRVYLIAVICALLSPAAQAVVGVKLVCDAPVFEFGRVDQSAVITNVFILKNAGDLSFVMQSIITSCDCTTASIDRRTIGPGESAKITAVFTAAGRNGIQKRRITLTPADGAAAPVIFYMEGFVETPAVSN